MSSIHIDRRQVEKVAHLSRLDLTDEELQLFSGQLSAIVEYIHKLDELKTDDVQPWHIACRCITSFGTIASDPRWMWKRRWKMRRTVWMISSKCRRFSTTAAQRKN